MYHRSRLAYAAVLVATFAAFTEAQDTARKPTDATTVLEKSQLNKRGLNRETQMLEWAKGHNGMQLAFLGDSITEFFNREVWDRNFGAYNPYNCGFSGENTEHILSHIANGILDGQTQLKVVVLLIGTNNLGHHGSEKPEWVADGIKAIVESLRKKLPTTKVLILGIFPRGSKGKDPMRARVASVNALIRKLEDGKSIRYLDIGNKFLEANGDIIQELMNDWLHPTPKGDQLWADAMQPLLSEMMK